MLKHLEFCRLIDLGTKFIKTNYAMVNIKCDATK